MRLIPLVLMTALGLVTGTHGAFAVAIPDGPQTSITIVLAAPDRAALTALGETTGISHEERMARLAALQPTAAQRQKVIDNVAGAGFTVTGVAPWSVTAQAPATRVRASFGAARAVTTPAGTTAAALPFQPAGLDGLVSAVFPTNPSGNLHHHHAVPYGPTGPQLRTSYSAPPGNPLPGKSGQTIATLQFSGWEPSDLTAYAAANGLPDPVASGQYVGIGVGRGTTLTSSDQDGDAEVALDQEALLSVAPNLKQRAYFAPNSLTGEVNTLHQIAADASDPTHNYYGLVALSVSWGICEDAYFLANGTVDTNSLNAELDAYASVLAAGVTTFSSAGDAGAYDCSVPGQTDVQAATTEAVDTPGSFPSVISVGGSSLNLGDPSTNADDVDTAWAEPASAAQAPYLGDGGGGGRSQLITRPAYQAGLSLSGTERLVPDIAQEAAPSNGIAVYWARGGSDPWARTGGTSLAAPLAAGMFADTMVSQGRTTGIGSIQSYLYDKPTYAGTGQTFRDIVSGDNSFGRDPSHQAGPGFDLSSGLGAPIWSGLAGKFANEPQVNVAPATRTNTVALTVTVPAGVTYDQWRVVALNDGTDPTSQTDCNSGAFTAFAPTSVQLPAGDGVKAIYVVAKNSSGCTLAKTSTILDTAAPKLAMTAALSTPTSSAVAVRWSATDTNGSGVDHYQVLVTHSLANTPDISATYPASRSVTIAGVAGRTYTIVVTAFDKAGNTSTTTTKVDVPYDDSRFTYSSNWGRFFSGADFGGSLHAASLWSSAARALVTFRNATAMMAFNTNGGRVDVFVDGRLVRTIDTYSAVTRYRVLVPFASFSSAAQHTVFFRVRSDHSSASRGSMIYLDALVLRS